MSAGWRASPFRSACWANGLVTSAVRCELARESAINHALRQLDMTRIIVAHRRETIAAADRVIVLGSTA